MAIKVNTSKRVVRTKCYYNARGLTSLLRVEIWLVALLMSRIANKILADIVFWRTFFIVCFSREETKQSEPGSAPTRAFSRGRRKNTLSGHPIRSERHTRPSQISIFFLYQEKNNERPVEDENTQTSNELLALEACNVTVGSHSSLQSRCVEGGPVLLSYSTSKATTRLLRRRHVLTHSSHTI